MLFLIEADGDINRLHDKHQKRVNWELFPSLEENYENEDWKFGYIIGSNWDKNLIYFKSKSIFLHFMHSMSSYFNFYLYMWLSLRRIDGPPIDSIVKISWLCRDRVIHSSAVTRIRTWVIAATTQCTNHYTITASAPATCVDVLYCLYKQWKNKSDEDGIRTHACRAQWISSPSP